MTATVLNNNELIPSLGFWGQGWQRLKRNKVGFVSFWIVAVYLLLSVGGWCNLLVSNWAEERAVPYAPPSWLAQTADDVLPPATPEELAELAGTTEKPVYLQAEDDPIAKELAEAKREAPKYFVQDPEKLKSLFFGADTRGRDVIQKVIKGASVSVLVGISGALLALTLGTVFGALSGYFGGKVDDVLTWFYSVFTSVPDMLLLLAFAAVAGRGISTIVLVMALTAWTGTYRLVRAEYMKLKNREYVQAADAIGASHARRMFVHILPNISHLLLIQFSLLTVALIKYEAILSFLGFGVGVGQVSLGSILAETPAELVQGYWWQMLAVTLVMSVLVTAFSLLVDALRDALDPKVK
ncbi:ABC transporter permease [Iodobacter arcticus]|uniref:ABC transporter permease n=1 Tax=Iodobacter arcticus TaxID=590593 RepID=A0ABW2QVS7_9NEIS